MRKLVKLIGFGILGLVVLIGGVVGYFVATWRPMYPDVQKPDITASTDPEVIARGRYLVDAVAHCGACHSHADEYSATERGQPAPLAGGYEWVMGPLGTIRSANITQDPETGIGDWTDAEIARAIRYGVGRDGRGLLYMMAVGPMSDEDLTAVVSYLRTVAPVRREVPDSEIGLMGKVLFQTAMSFFAAPHDYIPLMPPFEREGKVSLERGRYLAEGPAGCMGCHSQIGFEGDELVFDGPKGAGNATEPMPDMTDPAYEFAPPNLSADKETGLIAEWTEEQFVGRMTSGRVHRGSPMPWETYRNMTEEDVRSLWLWVRAIPPTKRVVGPPRREAGWKPGA